MQLPRPSEHARHWDLDPEIVFLNHGSFGACPRVVMQAQGEWRARLEREPVRFLGRELESLLDTARGELARFVRAEPDDLAFVPNATSGVNTVLRSLHFAPGDELVVTDQEYNACRNALDFVAERSGARVAVARVPFPIAGPQAVVDAVLAAVTPRTKFVLVDHVTSQTGVVFPVAEIARALRARPGGETIDLMIDGAHGPGMLDLDIPSLGASFYTGNCHKWLCTPKGSALLWVRRDRQPAIRPLSISHGANSKRTDRSRFRLEFDFTGTDDPTPFLVIPDAIRFLGSVLPGGHAAVREHNRGLARAARDALCQALGVPAPAPDAMLANLAAVPLPDIAPGRKPKSPRFHDDASETLFEQWKIEVPVNLWPAPPRRLVRIAAQLYNAPEQYRYLARALQQIFPR